VLVVVDAGLGTLNHTALTLEALAHRGLDLAGLVVGSWPHEPDLAARSNLVDLTALAARPLSGLMAANMGTLMPRAFIAAAKTGLGPYLGGVFDASDFVRSHRPDAPAR
jgi:dethiobiotin synthetase